MSKVFKKKLGAIIELAKEWRDFSRKANGWAIQHYSNDSIRCYFADNSDHTAVTFNYGTPNYQIQVSFFNHPRVDGFNLLNIDSIDSILKEGKSELDKEKAIFAKRTEDDILREREGKINSLKKQLNTLGVEL